MGFFSELKSDLSQAAKTIIPEEGEEKSLKETANGAVTAAEDSVKKTDAEVKKDLNEMLDHLDEIKLDEADIKEETKESAAEPAKEEVISEAPKAEENTPAAPAATEPVEEISSLEEEEEDTVADLSASLSAIESIAQEKAEEATVHEEKKTTNYNNGGFGSMDIQQQTPTDEVASITEGMKLIGNLETTGSLDLIGKVSGNVTCLGKLNVTGEIEGDSKAAEIYAEAARITGEVRSSGSVKIGQSTVVIGNIFATSAVIAGAVKGDIDVPGPVVLDTTAIVMGNIKSQSVQINNGAVIEGNCSQSYAEVNPSAFFEGLKGQK